MTRPDIISDSIPSHSVAVSNFVYFYSFHGLKTLARSPGSQTALKDLLYACCAGKDCEAVTVTVSFTEITQRLLFSQES